MNRDEAPTEVFDAIYNPLWDRRQLTPSQSRQIADAVWRVALPLIEADVRESIATEIGNTMFNVFDVSGPYYDGIRKAQSIARGAHHD